jgi:four helix bundle protein
VKDRAAVRSYRELVAWQRSMDLVEVVYAATRSGPKEEAYGFTSQIRRAVVSVPSNIAEGQGRSSTREFLHHLSIAYGSLLEVETQALVAHRLGNISQDVTDRVLASTAEAGRLINGLSRSLALKSPADH